MFSFSFSGAFGQHRIQAPISSKAASSRRLLPLSPVRQRERSRYTSKQGWEDGKWGSLGTLRPTPAAIWWDLEA